MLGQLAQQFGQALGMRGALRSALGGWNPETGRWQPSLPDPTRLARATAPHDRGAILVSAVFSAFVAIYKLRSADLFRIATNGTGVLPEGAIHPDLIRRLVEEAADAAKAVLIMCIRGLDYCPPVDVDFGSYLRAIITADAEVWPQDKYHHRVAFAEAFRAWGIYPEGVRGMSEKEIRYPRLDDRDVAAGSTGDLSDREATKRIFAELSPDFGLSPYRQQIWEAMQKNARVIHGWLTHPSMRDQLPIFGLTIDPNTPASVYRGKCGVPTIEVHSVRFARRRGVLRSVVTDLVVEVRQRRRGYFDREKQAEVDAGEPHSDLPRPDFRFRRGCTLIIDLQTQEVRYVIATRGDVTNHEELDRVRRFLTSRAGVAGNPFYGSSCGINEDDEHFAALHRHEAAAPDF
jgi:hypothetical protein